MNGLLTAPQAAEKLQVHVNTIYRYISLGILKAYKPNNGRWRIKVEDLEAFITQNGKATK